MKHFVSFLATQLRWFNVHRGRQTLRPLSYVFGGSCVFYFTLIHSKFYWYVGNALADCVRVLLIASLCSVHQSYVCSIWTGHPAYVYNANLWPPSWVNLVCSLSSVYTTKTSRLFCPKVKLALRVFRKDTTTKCPIQALNLKPLYYQPALHQLRMSNSLRFAGFQTKVCLCGWCCKIYQMVWVCEKSKQIASEVTWLFHQKFDKLCSCS